MNRRLMLSGLSLVIAIIVLGFSVRAAVIPTIDWCDFYSMASTLDDNPVPVGVVIDAYDPQGVHCGTFTVTGAGQWGVMHVYADDPKTDPDEGAVSGDVISFFIDGHPATVSLGDAIWVGKGLKNVDLEASSAPPTQVYEVSLTASNDGWNLVSFPLLPVSTAAADVLDNISGKYEVVYCYVNGEWQSYPDGGLDSIDQTRGMWIQVNQDCVLSITGTVPDSTTIPLKMGWNLIGWPADDARAVPTALVGIAGNYDTLYAYDVTDGSDPWERYVVSAPSYASDLQQVQPGRAYWVYAYADCDLVVGY